MDRPPGNATITKGWYMGSVKGLRSEEEYGECAATALIDEWGATSKASKSRGG